MISKSSDFSDFSHPEDESRRFADYIKNQHPELLSPPDEPRNRFQRWLKWVKDATKPLTSWIFATPEEFHGKHYVTPELEEHSQLTARWISVASLINAITNQPLLFFAFIDFGKWPAWGCSLVLNLLIVKFTNDGGTAVAGRKFSTRAWASAGAVGLIGMSVLQSFAAGIGNEAMNNGPELSRMKAIALIDAQTANLARIQPSSQEYERVKAEYERVRSEWMAMDRSHPNWNTLYVRLFGEYADRDRDWSAIPTPNLPLEKRVERLHEEAFAIKRNIEEQWQQQLGVRQQIGDDLVFLQQEIPALFEQHFHPDFQLRSGTERIRLATLSFFGKFVNGDWAGLGFPLFWFILSVITSGSACYMTFAHADREDTQMSRDETVGLSILTYLEDLRHHADDGNSESVSRD